MGDGDRHTETSFNTEAASNSMAAARSAPSCNTAAYRLAECHRGAAAHSAAASDASADPYRFAASNAGATLIGYSLLSDRREGIQYAGARAITGVTWASTG